MDIGRRMLFSRASKLVSDMFSERPMPLVDEKGRAAVALGYRADGSAPHPLKPRSDQVGQRCRDCQMFQGTASASAAHCRMLGGHVAGTGWCTTHLPRQQR